MPSFIEPLTVTCNACGASASTFDYQHPDRAVACGCCPRAHDHAGLGCRPVTVTGSARLVLLRPGDLLDALPESAVTEGEVACHGDV